MIALMPICLAVTIAAADPPERVDLRADDQPLLVLLERLARQCERGLVVDSELVSQLEERVTIDVRQARWADAIELFQSEYGLTVRVSDARLEIVDAEEEFTGQLVRDSYPVGMITEQIGYYPAPILGRAPRDLSAGSGGLLNLEQSNKILVDELTGWVELGTASPTWEREGVELSVQSSGNWLRVRQLPRMQEAVEAFIRDLEKKVGRQLICRFYRLADADAPDILMAEELAPRIEDRVPLAAFPLSDGQRNHFAAGVSREHTMDVETVHHTVDPIVERLRTGWALDVEAHVTRNGVLAKVRLAHCENPEMRTSQVGDGDGNPLAEVEMPVIDVDECADTRLVPRGGAATYRIAGGTYAVTFEVFGE